MRELATHLGIPTNISSEFSNVFSSTKQPTDRTLWHLVSEPTKDELRYMATNSEIEIGLLCSKRYQEWTMAKGTYGRMDVPPTHLMKDAIIFAHTHRAIPGINLTLPSLADITIAKPNIRQFVINPNGATYYSNIIKHPVTGKKWTPKNLLNDLNKVINPSFFSFREDQLRRLGIKSDRAFFKAYKEIFLEKMGVTIIQKAWQELPKNNPLSAFKV